jgi:aryl-alcohol dehydrogenase-like predicted oxidoreductase
MADRRLSRRDFLRDSALTAAGVAAGLGPPRQPARAADVPPEVKRTRSSNPTMEYRRLGKTGLWVSAVCLGGHWKRVDKIIKAGRGINPYVGPDKADPIYAAFLQNRRDVVERCMAVGINLIDLAGDAEPEVYGKVLQGRRDEMYLAYSHPASEMRGRPNRKAEVLLEKLEKGLKDWGIGYADVWRCMCLERGGGHTDAETEEMVKALEAARKKGLCRFTGLSTHDRPWAQKLIETYGDVIQVLVFPYMASSKELPTEGLFGALRKHDVGTLGIKPFGSASLFRGDGSPDHPDVEADDERARLAVRYILSNPVLTAPIPGLVSVQQVDNMALAVRERRQLDLVEKAHLEQAAGEMMARLPTEYAWLRQWEYV